MPAARAAALTPDRSRQGRSCAAPARCQPAPVQHRIAHRASTRKAASAVVALCILAGSTVAGEARDFSDREVGGRIEFIQNALDEGRGTADLWWHGWLGGYGALTAGEAIAHSRAITEKDKQDALVGAITSAFGVVGQFAMPLEAGRFAGRLRQQPADTPEARRAKLEAAEGFLRRAAAQEELGRSWRMHAISGAVNLGIGLFLRLRYNRPASDAFTAVALGQLVAEVQIFTQPTKAVRDLREYEARSDFGRGGATGSAHSTWYVSATPAGFLVGCRF